MPNGYDTELTLCIDGERVGAGGRATHRVVNPATGETLGDLPLATDAVIPVLRLEPSRWVIVMLMLGAIIFVRCLWAITDPTSGHVQMAVKQGLLSLVILDGAAAFAVEGPLAALLVLVLLLPATLLGTWIYST